MSASYKLKPKGFSEVKNGGPLGPPFFLQGGKSVVSDKVAQFQQLLGQLFAAMNNHDPAVLGKIKALREKIPEEPNLLQ